MPGRTAKLHMPFSDWPCEDRILWERAFANDNPFDDPAGSSNLSGATRRRYLFGWRRFLGFLNEAEPRTLDELPEARLTPERVKQFVAHLSETNAPQSVALQTEAVYHAARVMMPHADWRWLRGVKQRLHTAPRVSRDKPIVTSDRLLELGLELISEANVSAEKPIRMKDAVAFRDGLIFVLVAFRPLRRKNLSDLRVGQELRRKGNSWSICIVPDDSKNGEPINFDLPEIIAKLMDLYLLRVRPRFLKAQEIDYLWASPKGGRLSYSALWGIFCRHTFKHWGVRMNPHEARNAAATMWAIENPSHIEVVRDLLVHKTRSTTTKYIRADGVRASRTYSDLVRRAKAD